MGSALGAVASRFRHVRWGRLSVAVLALTAAGVGALFGIRELTEEEEQQQAPAPTIIVREDEEPEAAEELGFPAFATKNTTRVGGPDSAANAAGVALATFPSTGGVKGPDAVTLVNASDWPAGIAASVLISPPVQAPILVGEDDDVPDPTSTALDSLRPQGSPETDDTEAFRIGDVRVPSGLRTIGVGGADAAEVADAVDRLRQRLTDTEPQHILLAPLGKPAFAMPAAAWAARSGDPVLFVHRDSVPKPTMRALERHEEAPAFLLGPGSVASDRVLRQAQKASPAVQRVAGEDPVTNAIEFARFDAGSFGWNINDPGHGLVIANASQPLDAAAAAPLSGSGKWGPLLLTETPDLVPTALRGYLLDIKPGYRDDPTRAFYNHAWLIGNESALSISFQAQVDELLELAQVQGGTGAAAAP